ncbi:hypothetical protein NQT66_14825 [Cellulophaga baltica]|uniref:hypothetical protein n=1 Tax=Cellulophaga baltica TaxID=76594 RepID=UPI0021492722|nr:hypothetical protein [Cellulophaga baltica]MCR1026094.1 hypothetical protein [Cellulophaga baltica]
MKYGKTLLFTLSLFIYSCYNEKNNFIPELSIEEINYGFESKLGFKLTKTEPNQWQWKQKGGGGDFNVKAISPDSKNVSYFMISVKIDSDFTEQDIVIQFASSMVNKGVISSNIVHWVKTNYNNHKATTIIDNVKITIGAPTSAIRKVEFEVI